jgi:hypothetical protein
MHAVLAHPLLTALPVRPVAVLYQQPVPDTIIGFDTPQVISVLVGVVLPLITGFITPLNINAGARAITLLVLAGITSFLTAALDSLNTDTVFDWRAVLLTVLGTFLTGVGAHFGLWKPTGAADAAKRSGVKGTR